LESRIRGGGVPEAGWRGGEETPEEEEEAEAASLSDERTEDGDTHPGRGPLPPLVLLSPPDADVSLLADGGVVGPPGGLMGMWKCTAAGLLTTAPRGPGPAVTVAEPGNVVVAVAVVVAMSSLARLDRGVGAVVNRRDSAGDESVVWLFSWVSMSSESNELFSLILLAMLDEPLRREKVRFRENFFLGRRGLVYMSPVYESPDE
jgi:hypothetical protein